MYLRKSRADLEAETHGEGETLARHERALRELARRQQLNVTEVYREVVSGETIAARPVMQRLLSEVGRGRFQGVLVMEVERLARGDTMDQGLVAQTFRYADTKIITPLKTYDPQNEFDEEYFEFGLFMSRREYKAINRRLQRGRLASAKEGKYVAPLPPYGYLRQKLAGEKGFTLAPHPEQADVVRLIFDYYVIGERQPNGGRRRLGISLIAKRLSALRIPPQKGEHWSESSVRDILKNPVYLGKIRWNFRPAVKKMVGGRVATQRPRQSKGECLLVDGLHEGLVEPAVFYAAQELMANNPPSPTGGRKTVKNPLAGLIRCGKCGRSMVRRPYSTSSGQADALMCPNPNCDTVSTALQVVEERLLSALDDWLAGYRLGWETVLPLRGSLVKTKKEAHKRLEQEIKTLFRQRETLCDLLERGVYDDATFLERRAALQARIQQAAEEKEALFSDIRLQNESEAARGQTRPKADGLMEVYRELPTPKAKNDFLKEIVEKVIYTKEESGRWHGAPDAFELILFPRLPRRE